MQTDRERVLELLAKIKQAYALMDEVDREITTCNGRSYGVVLWHIYKWEEFKYVCNALGASYQYRHADTTCYPHEYSIMYDGVRIFTLREEIV